MSIVVLRTSTPRLRRRAKRRLSEIVTIRELRRMWEEGGDERRDWTRCAELCHLPIRIDHTGMKDEIR